MAHIFYFGILICAACVGLRRAVWRRLKSGSDAWLVVAFFVVLILPAMKIDTAEKSEQEKRTLAAYRPLVQDGRLNADYGKDFEAWFGDHFLGRNKLVEYHSFIKSKIGSPSKALVLVGENEWLFFKGDDGVNNYRNVTEFSADELSRMTDYVASIDAWCRREGKKFVFLIAPDKHRVYGRYYPTSIRKVRDDSQSRTEQFVAHLRKTTSITVVYPRASLLAASEAPLYYKHDTHWAPEGAFIGYRALMASLGVEPPPGVASCFEQAEEKRFVGDLVAMLRGWNAPDETLYKEPRLAAAYMLSNPDADWDTPIDLAWKGSAGGGRIFLLRDSFATALLPFLADTFGSGEVRWRGEVLPEDLPIMRADSDYVVLEIVERGLPLLQGWTFPKE